MASLKYQAYFYFNNKNVAIIKSLINKSEHKETYARRIARHLILLMIVLNNNYI